MEIHSTNLVFILFLCSFIFTSEGQDDLIQKICPNARNPNACFELFKGESGKAPPELAKKAITQAGLNAINTNTILTLLSKAGSTNPKLKVQYEACSTDYTWLMRNLDRAAQSILDFNSMNDFTLSALVNVNDCVKRLGGAPVSPPNLNDKIEDIRNLCSIIIAISAIK